MLHSSFFAFPINVVLVFSLIFILFLIKNIPSLANVWKRISSPQWVFISVVLFFIAILCIQLTRTFYPSSVETTHLLYKIGLSRFYGSPLLIIVVLWLLFVLMANHATYWKKKLSYFRFFYTFFTLGAILLLISLFLGVSDQQQYKTLVHSKEKNAIAYLNKQQTITLPFSLQLEKIEIERYQSGTPKQIVVFFTLFKNETPYQLKSYVNGPAHFENYDFYLLNYDTQNQNNPAYASFLIVKEPWKKLTIMGIICLMLASIMLIFSVKISRKNVN